MPTPKTPPAAHTPTPWRIALPNGESDYQVVSDDTLDCAAAGLSEPNAAFIVRAVNSHEALVAALAAVLEYEGYPVDNEGAAVHDLARAALKLAAGEL